MEVKKQIIDDIFKCYSVNALSINGETHLVFAAEGDGSCHVYTGNDFQNKKVLWEGGGGTMSLATIPDMEGCFFASKGFYSMVDSGTSAVYFLKYSNGEFTEKKIFDIPYLHRFDVFNIEDARYIIAATIHSGKTDKEDWSKPGKVLVGKLPMDLNQDFEAELSVLVESLTKNHGFNRGVWNGKEAAFIASEEGVMAVMPPQNGDDWSTEQIFNHPVSDVAAIDIDGDGELEFALLSPFHGDQMDIFKKIDGKYEKVYSYPKHMDFYHAIFADEINGVPSFVLGARKEDQELYVIQYDKEADGFNAIVLDSGVGSSNARVIHTKKGDLIMSANRQLGQAAIYSIKS